MSDKILEAIIIGVFVSLTAFMGSAILRTYRNEEKIFANESTIGQNREDILRTLVKIDEIHRWMIEAERDRNKD